MSIVLSATSGAVNQAAINAAGAVVTLGGLALTVGWLASLFRE